MKIKIHELAAKEFNEAIEWYEIQQKDLGRRFKTAVMNQIKKNQKQSKLVFNRRV